MIYVKYWLRVLLLAALLGVPTAAGYANFPSPAFDTVATIQNEFIQVNVNELGQFTIGTLQGDPLTSADDNKKLMYGHGANGWTSFTSVRAISGGTIQDMALLSPASQPPAVSGDSVSTVWTFVGVEVRQTLTLSDNPFTNRRDTVKIATMVTNTGSQAIELGVRVMLDTMIGENDDAPFFIPDTGNTSQEHEYIGAAIPSYWKAFEASDYSPASLKGQGLLTDFGTTPPDRFVVASWRRIKDTVWDYSITPGRETGDSAVAIYWLPKKLQPGESVTWITCYGLAGVGGGTAWFDAPLTVTSLAPEFKTTLWISNKSEADFAGGEATLTLPPGLLFATGETARKPLPRVPKNGGAQSVSWQLVATGNVDVDYPYSATVAFQSGSGPLTAETTVRYQKVSTPTPTYTPTSTPTPTLTPTPTPCPTSLVPFVPDTCWLWWPWLLLIPLLAVLIGVLLWRRQQRPPPPPVAPTHVKPRPTAPVWPAEKKPTKPSGADVTHGRDKRWQRPEKRK